MRFLALSPLVTLALIAVVLTLVAMAYLFKPGRRRVAVTSLALWAKVLGKQHRIAQRWRWWLSLLLAAVIAVALALALARPEPEALSARSQRVVLMLDNSATMAVRTGDGATRWQHAIAQARQVVSQLGAASEVMVLDSMGQAPVAGYVSPVQAWRMIEDLPLVNAGRPRVRDLPMALPNARVHWFTDGVALPAPPDGVVPHSVFEPARNMGITAFDARPRPDDPTQVRALAEITNGSDVAATVTLALSGPGYEQTRQVAVAPGESVQEIFDLSSGQAGLYRAMLRADDALATDDTGFAWVPSHAARTVLLVTPGSPRLEDSMRALPGIDLSVVRPQAFRGQADHDIVVFDRVAPTFTTPQAVMYIGASALIAGRSRPVQEAAVVAWDSIHPMARGVAWSDLRIRRGRLGDESARQEGVLVSAAPFDGGREGALIIVNDTAPRRVQLGFALEDSNFTLQPGFPVFLANAIDWLKHETAPVSRDVGEVAVPGIAGEVRDERGRALPSFMDDSGTRFTAAAPGLYNVTQGDKRVNVLVNAFDPVRTRVNDSALAPRALPALNSAGSGHVVRTEFWTALLLLAALLLMLEWAGFTRKVTV